MIYSPSLTMVGHYWKKRFGIINGVVTSGSAVFTLAMYYVLEFLMDEYNVSRKSYLYNPCTANKRIITYYIRQNYLFHQHLLVGDMFSHTFGDDGHSNALCVNLQARPRHANENRYWKRITFAVLIYNKSRQLEESKVRYLGTFYFLWSVWISGSTCTFGE